MSTHSRMRPVVVGVDGSETTALAIAWAVDYAVGAQAPLRLVAAYQPDALETGLDAAGAAVGPTSRLAQAVARGHANAAAAYAKSLGFSLPVETAFVADPAPRVLLDESRDALIVVVGSRRLGRLHRALHGSTGALTSAKGGCPLVVVREGPSRSLNGTRVIVGIDGPGSHDAAAFAFAEAERIGCGLTAVHAWHLDSAYLCSPDSPAWGRQELEARGHALLDQVIDPLSAAQPGVDVCRYVTEGAATHLLEALSMNARMLVVGSRCFRPIPALLLGSVSRRMVTHAHCPVVIVHTNESGGPLPAVATTDRREQTPVG